MNTPKTQQAAQRIQTALDSNDSTEGLCDGFKVPQHAAWVSNEKVVTESENIRILMESGSSLLSSNFWVGPPEAGRRLFDCLSTELQDYLNGVDVNEEEPDTALVGLWEAPGTTHVLVATMGWGDNLVGAGDSADAACLSATADTDMHRVAFDGNDNTPFDIAEWDESASVPVAVRLALLKEHALPSVWEKIRQSEEDTAPEAVKSTESKP